MKYVVMSINTIIINFNRVQNWLEINLIYDSFFNKTDFNLQSVNVKYTENILFSMYILKMGFWNKI